MRRTFMSMKTKPLFLEDMTCDANTEPGDLGAC